MSFLSEFSRASLCFSRKLEAVSREEREEHPCFSLSRVLRARQVDREIAKWAILRTDAPSSQYNLSPSSNFTLVARRSATSEGTLYRSDGGFYRTEVQVASTGVWIVGAVTVLVIFFAKILVLPPIVRKPHNYGKMEIKHNCFMYIRCTGEREGK